MKKLLLLNIIITMIGCVLSKAGIIELGKGAHVDIPLPPGWSAKINTKSSDKKSYRVDLTVPSGKEATCSIVLSRAPGSAFATGKADGGIKESLERLITELGDEQGRIENLAMENGSGLYCVLIGQKALALFLGADSQKYKALACISMQYDNGNTAFATMLLNEPGDKILKEVLAFIPKMQFTLPITEDSDIESGRPEQRQKIEITKGEKGTVIGNPHISRVSLLLPATSFIKGTPLHISPGYFIGRDAEAGLTMSGWFEPLIKFKYRNARELWRGDTPSKAKKIEYLKVNEWDVMIYETEIPIDMPGGRMVTLRANLLLAGTWIDLHLSVAGIDERVALRQKLTDYMKAIQTIVSEPLGFQLETTKQGVLILSPGETGGRLFIKSKELSPIKMGAPSKPGLFQFQDNEDSIVLIAWLRPASDYKYAGVEELWDETRTILKREGVVVVNDFEQRKSRGWEMMLYDIKTSDRGMNNVNLRASCVADGIWFDVHLTTIDRRSSAVLRGNLRAYLTKLSVAAKQAGGVAGKK